MIKTTLTVAILATTGIFTVVNDFQSALPQPVEICKEDPRLTEVRKALVILGRDSKYAKDIFVSATSKNIDPILWVANIECESEFKITAKSKKGYKGLSQTPKAAMKTGFELGDLTYGACVLDEKLKIAKGDMTKAMMLYKGGNNPAAKKCADKVFALYHKLQKQVREDA
jgi:soluble lytic murein transglycosylase-like protein